MDIRKWLARQCQHLLWTGPMNQQRERLEGLGTTSLARPRSRPRRPWGTSSRAWRSLAQYKAQNADTGNKEWVNYAFNSTVSYALYLIMTAFQPVTK
ncbi:hypothetical protein ACIA6D_41685 [Streptomyces cacaoi]